MAWTIHAYDTFGSLQSTKQVRDFATQVGPGVEYGYDAQGLNVTSITRRGDKNGDGMIAAGEFDTAALTYDTLGRLKTGITADWYPTQFDYDSLDRVVRGTDAVGQMRDYNFDPNGNSTEVSLTLDINGVATLIDRTSFGYDLSDRRTTTTDAGGFVTRTDYDPSGNALRITNPDNYSLAFDYDEAGRAYRAYDQEGNAVSTTRDIDGKPRTVTDPNGGTTSLEYWDASRDGRLKRRLDPLGRATSYDYDPAGNVVSVTDNLGRTTLTSYDELNRAVRVVGPAYMPPAIPNIPPPATPDHLITRYRYDTLGNLVEVAAGGNDSIDTDPSTDAVEVQISYGYDDFGRKIRETDALDQSWTFTYDVYGTVLAAVDAMDQSTSYTWGYGHQLLTVLDAQGHRTSYSRNELGQVLTAQSPEVTYAYTYDAAHRMASVTDGRGNKKLSYAWSPGGLLDHMQDNEGRRTDYLYDAVGRLTAIWSPADIVVGFAYDAGGRLTEKWFPNGINAQYSYNADGSLRQIKNRLGYSDASDTILSQHDYEYDGLGNRRAANERVGFFTPPPANDIYAYGRTGNRNARVSDGGPIEYFVHQTGDQLRYIFQVGRIRANLVYDANGNLTRQCEGWNLRQRYDCSDNAETWLTYDARNRLVGVGRDGQPPQSYGYDDQGRRIRKTVGDVTTYYVYDGPDIVAEYTGSFTQPTAHYVHGPGTDDPILRETGSGTQFYHQDGLGSVVAVSDASGMAFAATQIFDAWGNRIASASRGTIPTYGYTGREPDETGLIYYRARYYDPRTARFTQRDPIGLAGGLNAYAYVANNPLNATDPSGLLDIFIGGCGDHAPCLGMPGMRPTHIVADYVVRHYSGGLANANVAYFGYDQHEKIADRINAAVTANPAEPINLIGHSYGAHTAAQIAGSVSVPINQLITIDPVGRRSVGAFRSNVQAWTNVKAQPSQWNRSDWIAFVGGKGGGLPTELAGTKYSIDTNHEDFEGMMRAPGPSGASPESMLRRFGANFGPVPTSGSQSLRSLNPPPTPKR